LAWDPFNNGKTIFDASFGFFDVLPLPYEIQYGELFSAPFFKSGNVTNLPAGSFPTGAFNIAAASTRSSEATYFDPNPHRNYVMQWNTGIQRQFRGDLTVKVGYVGSRGVHNIFRVSDADIVLPTLTKGGYLWPSPSGSGTRVNTNFGRIIGAFWQGDSFYDALAVQVKKRISRSFQFSSSYTWGKAIDTSSGSIEGDEYTNALTSPLWFAPKLGRGLSDFNVNQDLKLIYSWEIGGPRSAPSLETWALGGWQIGGVFETSTGIPFTPGVGGDALGVNSTDPNIDVPDVVASPNCTSLINPGNPTHFIKSQCLAAPNPIALRGNIGRNTIFGPRLVNLDFSLIKNNYIKHISNSCNVQLRAEFFNIFNHPNFDPPINNRSMFDSKGNPVGSGGLMDTTQTPSRQIQFAVKLIW